MSTLSIILLTSSLPPNWLPISNKDTNLEALSPLDTVQMSGGLNFTTILKEDGSIWTFGRNDFGSLGHNDFIDRSAPTRIDPSYFNNEKVVQVEASSITVIARTETNKVYQWGNGTPKPQLIYNNLPIIDIDASGKGDVNTIPAFHIVTSEGVIKSSGSNVYGTFGIGTGSWYSALGACTSSTGVSTNNFTYTVLKSAVMEPCPDNSAWQRIQSGTDIVLDNVIDISVNPSGRKMLAYTSTGELYTWGEGNGYLPKKLPSSEIFSIAKIEMSAYPTFLTTDGKLYYYPSTSGAPVEITLEGSTNSIVDVKSGQDHLLVLDATGQLFGLGPNQYGNLGNIIPSSGVSFSTGIAKYTGINNVKRIGAGVSHSIIQYYDLRFATLGRNSYGELSTTDVNSKSTFVQNPLITNVKDISAINYTSFAATNDNKFYSWGGRNTNEVIKRSGPINEPGLVKDFSSISNIVEVNGFSDSYIHGGVLLENGEYWNYGENWKHGLGRPAEYYTITEPVINRNSSQTGTDFGLMSASQGNFHGTGIGFDNKVYTWGYDSSYLLGLGYHIVELVGGRNEDGWRDAFQNPIVPNDETFIKTYSGNNQNILLTDTGNVYVWGNNLNNRFGMSGNPTIPTLLNSLPPIKEVAFGSHHNLFLDFSGNVWAAGHNAYGQLGLGHTSSPSIPTKIPSLSNIKSIGAGRYSSYAVTESGEVYSFGDNRNGQLGLGDLIQRNEPRLVTGITNVKKVTGGRKHALLLTDLGNIYVTGSDAEGQLGLAQSQVNDDPVIVVFPPNVTISTPSNQVLTVDDTFEIVGEVYSETEGVNMNLQYEIESSSGKTTSFMRSYITGSTPEPFSISIPLSSYPLGSYTVIVKATTDSGVSGQAAINFSVQDKIKPTISVDLDNVPKWSVFPVSVNVTADDTGGSGYRGFRHSITNSTSVPTSWSSFDPSKTGTIIIDKSGTNYLHLEAYDNIGNVTYLQAGPYYIDTEAPDFVFTEPLKWQQDYLNLGVSANDASNVLVKKWLQGTYTMDEVKTTGNSFTGNSIPISLNGTYSFYAVDENNQESLEYYTVSNINYQPILQEAPTNILIPSTSKGNYNIPTKFTHYDDEDSTNLELNISSTIINSINPFNNDANGISHNWNINGSTLTENQLHSGQIYLKDSRNGISNKINVQLEVFNPDVQIKNKVSGINISWTHSKISQDYRLLRDGEVIYTGTNNSFFDNTTPNTTHNYRLQVLLDGVYIEVSSLNGTSGYNFFETPVTIVFPPTNIGNGTGLSPILMDIEHIKYEDLSDINTPYSLRVSITDFESSQSSFSPSSFILKNVKKLDRSNLVTKTFSDIYVSSTPTELVSSFETTSESYTKLEILKENIKLDLPIDIKLSSGSSENFSGVLIWEISFTP